LANFFLIDHSLQQPGGHHSDYANCVARAANEMGFMTTIGTHRKLAATDSINQLGVVRRVFRQSTYQRDSYLAGLRHLTRAKRDYLKIDSGTSSWKRIHQLVSQTRHQGRRQRLIRGFGRDCYSFFKPTLFSDGDHAFFTTVSELELMGLAAYLATEPRTLQVHWHLQFHYNLFEGRTPEYDEQLTVARAIQACFDAALARVPYHAIHFYTTSEALADQYNRLGVGEFEVLPYPVSPAFCQVQRSLNSVRRAGDKRDVQASASTGPLRVTCPGGIRREKGHLDYLQPLVDKIWEPHLAAGKVKIVVQRSENNWRGKQKLELQVPRQDITSESEASPIEYLKHPLSHEDYIKFISSTDCGLLFYDSRIYFSRRAGVLGELLSCGKPVIVPAGSWLSEQIQNPIYKHVERLMEPAARQLSLADIRCDSSNVPLPGGVVSFDQFRHPFVLSFDREDGETGFAMSFDWHWPDVPGIFARIEVTQFDADGNSTSKARQVVGPRRELADSRAFFHFSKATSSVEIRIRNAFHDSNASVKNLQIATTTTDRESTPRGAVGIIAADQDDLPTCIDELVEHYQHYRDTAELFAETWSRQHQPRRTIAHLISTGNEARRAA
jgi:glycosyltransferase involved in cell wall biosynthesis